MAFQYTEEMEKFIHENYMSHNTTELAGMFNEKFGTNKTKDQIRAYRRRHGLDSTHLQGGLNKVPEEIRDFIFVNHKGTSYADMAEKILQEFGISYTEKQMRSYYKNHKLQSGLTARQPGVAIPGCEKGWFLKGKLPPNSAPIGTEKIRSNGYIWVKVEELPNKWRMKHLIVWEEANGPIPKGWKIYFKDGDPLNCNLENLMLVENRVRGIMNRTGLSEYKGDLAEAAVNTARLQLAISDAKKKGR